LSTSKSLNSIAESGTIECSESGSFAYDGSETSATFTFNNCTESGITMNGTLSMTMNNDGTSGTLTYTNFSIIQDENNKVVYTSATAAFSFDSSYELINMTITINAYQVISGERTDFDNYRLTFVADSNYNVALTVNGSIRSDCLGGWVEITTNEAIQGNAYDDCPSAGQIVISGNASSLTVTFNADGSVDVSGAVTDHYDSCNDLDTGACSNY